MKKKITRRDEYIGYRTSWKWFDRKISELVPVTTNLLDIKERIQFLIQLEILKELQYLNDRRS